MNYSLDKKPPINLSTAMIYMLGLVIWHISRILNITLLSTLNHPFHSLLNGVRGIGIVLIIISFVLTIMRKRVSFQTRYLIITGVVLLFFLVNNVLLVRSSSFLDIIIILVASLTVDLDSVIKHYFWIRIISLALVILLSLVSVLPTASSPREGVVRCFLGFSWTSYAPFGFLFCILYRMWDVDYKPNWIVIVSTLAVNQILYQLTDTKFPYAITIITVVIWWLETHIVNMNARGITSTFIFLSYILLPLLLFAVYYFSIHAASFPKLNNVLSGRLQLGYEGIQKFGIGFFGQHYRDLTRPKIVSHYFTIDSGLLRYMVNYGIISTIIVVVSFNRLMLRLIRDKMNARVLVFFITIIIGLTDPWVLNIDFNIFILCFALLGQTSRKINIKHGLI
ncbi:MAG: hypothetical protein ACTIDH_02450 [Lactobacillus sp.]